MSWNVEQKDEKRVLYDIEKPNVKFAELLRNTAIFKLVRDQNFSTLTYLSKHIQEIINTCFPLDYEKIITDECYDWETGSRSFLLFTKAPSSLLEALFQNDAIYIQMSLVFMKIHNDSKPPYFLLSRISSILVFIVSNIPKEVNNCIGFIYQLLPFVDEPGVFDLFIQICSSDKSFELIQNSLVESNFSEHIINEIKKHRSYFNNSICKTEINLQEVDIPDESLNRASLHEQKSDSCLFKKDKHYHELHVSLLLRITRFCNENKILKESFSSIKITETFYSLIDSPILILNELWDAITSISSSSNEGNMIVFLPRAADNIREPFDKVFRYQSFSLEFIAKMMKLKSKGLSESFLKQIQQIILRLIVQFPDSTNLLGSIFRLIKYGIISDDFSDQFIENFVPLMIVEASNRHKNAVQANTRRLLWKFNTKPKYKSIKVKLRAKIDNYSEFCSSVLDRYQRIIDFPYGGEMQNVAPDTLFSSSFMIF